MMEDLAYRYSFGVDIAIEDAEASLLLAVLAAEALHGMTKVRLDAGHYFDAEERVCVIRGDTHAGADVSRLFLHFLSAECGPESFRVERITRLPPTAACADVGSRTD